MRLHVPLIILALMFILPVVTASYMLAHRQKANSATNCRHFVTVPYALQLHDLQHIAGENTINKWTMVYAAPSNCDSACEQSKTMLKNLHRALGANSDRVTVVTLDAANLNISDAVSNILILNPQGLYIMRYTNAATYAHILKDMRRLLNNSHA